MAVMKSVVCRPCRETNQRIEMQMVATFSGSPNQTYTFNVSYKKHAISSYKTNSSPPPSAEVNTLVNMNLFEFKSAFTDYGRRLAAKMKGQDSAKFNPSAPRNRIVTRQIMFSSDAVNLGGNVHCFPFNSGPAQTPKAISINRSAFNNFKTVTQYLFRLGGGPTKGAMHAWKSISTLVEARVGQPNELFTQTEVATLKVRFKGSTMDRIVKEESGAIKKALNRSRMLK